MKKLLYLLTLTISSALLVTAIFHSKGKVNTNNIYRLHIIANSNSDADQSVKLEIRNAIIAYEKQLFEEYSAPTTALDTKKLLMHNASSIYGISENILEKHNFHYGVKLSTGTYDFPDRTYSGQLYPAGKYDALRVVLGDGKGENWWCVMFPPLCIIDEDGGKIEDKEAAGQQSNSVQFKSIFASIWKWLCDRFK